ncbi:MAG: sn-glycerol-3-phosphate ABC transporter ATP-binding protein UgpC [Ignavibacteriaceae bacterium]|nr:sn-glycerol-3-phosphate ABC transporter ATP-binding protein UgpC [Ignavibacteriaceae bacterium]
MADVRLVNVSKMYEGGNTAVKDVNIEIKDKEFVVLVGPSGCGKSTTLRMIAGLEEISSGELIIDGKVVNNVSPKDRDIAMVFQNYALYPHMTVYDNMAFGLKLRKFSKEEINQRVTDAAKILGLEDYLERKPKALSGGQRQRVAVGRAIVRKPKVFLFDEPLSNLDAKLRVQMRTEISKLHQRLEATMVYVTHDQVEAMTMGDKIVVMKDGFVQQIDSPLNLYNHPVNKFVAGFIGSPAMNFIPGYLKNEGKLQFHSNNNEFSFPLGSIYQEKLKAHAGKSVVMGIRPEDFFDVSTKKEGTEYYEIIPELEVVEPMGNEVFLYFTLEGVQITARIPTRERLVPRTKQPLYMDLSKLHFFDAADEKSLLV